MLVGLCLLLMFATGGVCLRSLWASDRVVYLRIVKGSEPTRLRHAGFLGFREAAMFRFQTYTFLPRDWQREALAEDLPPEEGFGHRAFPADSVYQIDAGRGRWGF